MLRPKHFWVLSDTTARMPILLPIKGMFATNKPVWVEGYRVKRGSSVAHCRVVTDTD